MAPQLAPAAARPAPQQAAHLPQAARPGTGAGHLAKGQVVPSRRVWRRALHPAQATSGEGDSAGPQAPLDGPGSGASPLLPATSPSTAPSTAGGSGQVALRGALRDGAARAFLAAGALKVVATAAGPSTMLATLGFLSPYGPLAALALLPFGAGLLALADWCLRNNIYDRPRMFWSVVLGSIAVLGVMRLVARPQLKPLPPAYMVAKQLALERASGMRQHRPLPTAEDAQRVMQAYEQYEAAKQNNSKS